jgi:hypothetical protein
LSAEQFEKGMSRRGLVQALAIGAAGSSFSTPAAAQQTVVLAEATSADYVRDPARWGSPEVAALFPGFKHLDMRTSGAVIRLRYGGSGPPLLLLHGNSQNHATWYGVLQAPPPEADACAKRSHGCEQLCGKQGATGHGERISRESTAAGRP